VSARGAGTLRRSGPGPERPGPQGRERPAITVQTVTSAGEGGERLTLRRMRCDAAGQQHAVDFVAVSPAEPGSLQRGVVVEGCTPRPEWNAAVTAVS
jgi:hypothetical protein